VPARELPSSSSSGDHTQIAYWPGMTAAMPPGINAYIFAALYGRAMRVAASTVLVATAASVLTAWVWLALLGT